MAVAPAELEGAFAEGIGFDGSAIEGFARVYESDMVARPDPSTFQVLPWSTETGDHYSARMFCDIAMPDGSPSWADPRHVLRRALSKAGEAGFTCYVHPEIEFYLLRDLKTDGSAPSPPTTAATSTSPATTSPRTSGATPSRRWSRWASRWSSATTRAAPASRRSTCATPTR